MKKLGIDYSREKTCFRVLAPTVETIKLLIYEGPEDISREIYDMKKDDNGIYEANVEGDLNGKFYTYLVDGRDEVTDPYSYAVSLNGIRSSILDLEETNPKGFKEHKIPFRENLCKSVIYEVHIKDFTIDPSSNVIYKGKYLGFCQEGTNYNGLSTGIDHLKELGITHVHLMPVFDYLTVKEEKEYFHREENYNWGYDPEHYNTAEGSYSIRPEDPKMRIKELKTMIMRLHEAGISVVMDVVYNHTYRSETSNFNVLYPNYFYRRLKNNVFSNGSYCGNELATEKKMVRRFIKESLIYWLKEYKVDGFRFDLMALMDIDTTLEIVEELKEIKEDILIYGEPWTAGSTTLSEITTTSKGTQTNKGFAFFNDEFRDAIKGDNDGYGKGFAQGNIDGKKGVETGIVGSIYYDEAHIGFTARPCETINYVNSHDNLILQDKLLKLFPNFTNSELLQYNKFVMSILFTSQGIPFIHAGNEFLRSKNMVSNSYKSPISVNAIDWSLKGKNIEMFNYMKDLIELKRTYPEFSLTTAEEIKNKIKFLDTRLDVNFILFTIKGEESGKYYLVIHNGKLRDKIISIPTIKEHLKYHYYEKPIDIKIKEIFNRQGLIRDKAKKKDSYGIKTASISTSIWEIKKI